MRPEIVVHLSGGIMTAADWRFLTSRKREVVSLVSQGLSNKEVAQRLNIAEGTVKLHLHRIYSQLGVRNRTALAALAMRPAPVSD
jgi:two-component system, NarL family, nitrate/nitrite response regulator NarL